MKTLAKYHGYLIAVKLGPSWDIDPVTDGWTQAEDPANVNVFFSETFFDLAGMSKEEKTLFIEAATTQQNGFTVVGNAAGDNVQVYDIMTSIPIDIRRKPVQDAIVQRGLGFPGSFLDFEHVIYQRYRRYSCDLDFQGLFPVLAEEHQSGSLEATASDRIYSYRLINVILQADGSIILPPVRHLINVKPVEEPTYQHIMRLKRSYDLQQSYDED